MILVVGIGLIKLIVDQIHILSFVPLIFLLLLRILVIDSILLSFH